MNEINSSEFIEDDEYKKIMWDQLDTAEKMVMKTYVNILANDKIPNQIMMNKVNAIMIRYPDFDISYVP